MICYCPYCGHYLKDTLKNGISSCFNCSRVFDSSEYHKILSISWLARKRNFQFIEQLSYLELNEFQINLIDDCIIKNGLCHDEFLKVLSKFSLAKEIELPNVA